MVVARPVAWAARLTGPDVEDVIAAAQLRLVELLDRKPGEDPGPFDPTEGLKNNDVIGAFRGWAYRSVRDAAVSEANRIRTAGTIKRKVRPENLAKAKALIVSVGDAASDLSRPDADTAAEQIPVEEIDPQFAARFRTVYAAISEGAT